MKEKPTYKELENELKNLKKYNRDLSREITELKADKEKPIVRLSQNNSKPEIDEEKLRTELYLFDVLMEIIPGRIYFKNRKSEFVKISNSLAKLHGMGNPDDVIGKTDFDFFTKEHAQKAFNDEQKMIKTGVALKGIEEKETWKNGKITWSSTSKIPIIDKNGQIIGVFGISRDITERKRAEQALKESEEKARIILNTTGNYILLCTPEGIVCDCNDAFCEITKLKKEELIGKNHLKLLSSEKEKLRKLQLRKVCETKQVLEIIDETSDLILQTSLKPIVNEEGNVRQIAIYARDVTENIKSEKALKENEEKLRNILENSTNLFYTHTPKHILTYMSPQVVDILGYTPEETMIKWTELASENPVNGIGFLYTQKAIDTGIAQAPFELELIHKNKSNVWVEVHEKPIVENGKTTSIVGALIDITDRKKAERALKDSISYKKALFYRSSTPLIVMDVKTHQYIDCNDAAVKIYGYKTKEEVLGKTPINASTKKQYNGELSEKAAIEKINIALNEGSVLFEWRHQRPNKDVWDAEVHLMSITHKGEKLLQFSLLDITNRKKAEQALKENESKLRNLNATKDKFFSIIAHDLRSPFNTMLGFAKLLENKFDSFDIPKQKKFLGILTQDLENTYNLLENLLLWARTQRGTIDFYPEKENLYLCVGETIDLLRQMLLDKEIIVENSVAENIYVHADKNMLLTILRNLLSNAIKFTQKGGEIVINTQQISNKSNQKFAQILVKDSGVGIANDRQLQLFEISENSSTKGTEGESGTGLGLILCKEFVEKHGGKIWVESKEGEGSEFIFTIPEIK